jgi:hypothetical protein
MVNKCLSGCGKTASFNILGEKKGIFCAGHKLDGMRNVIDKTCENENCSNKRATFGFPNEKPKYCNSHYLDGMVNLAARRCKGVNGIKCYVTPIYNLPTETKGLYCITHKSEDMINVTGKRCEEPNCKVIAQFNVKGEKYGRFCSKHKLDGMIDIKHSRCEFVDCNLSPCYKFKNDTHCRFCSKHKLDGMIDGKHRKCIEEGCNTSPSYNYADGELPLYCFQHKLEDMVDIKHELCNSEGCNLRPMFNYSCETKGVFCNSHKLDNMEDVVNKQCLSEWCNTRKPSNKYEGYCLFCYIHLFPDKPVTRNYKTKEKSVVDFVLNNFPNFSWVSDKKIQDGCSRRRPDLLLDLGYQVIIIEVDENQHINYDCSCENKRLMEISQDIGHRPIIFIRFNPDSYINKNNQLIKSCWRANQNGIFIITKDNNKEWNNRLDILKNQIEYWSNNETNKTIEVIHLFYDKFDI